MSKSKRARSRCAPKPRSNPALARALLLTVGRERIRSRRVLRLLCRPNGATVATIMESTGWQPHSVRGSFAGGVRKRLGLKLASETSDRGRVYRIGGGYDVVVTVTGSRQTVVTFRKARVLGIWVNANLRVIENAPAYIDVLSNKPLEEVANAETLRRLQPAWATMAYPQISFHASHAGKGRNDFSGMTRPRPVMAVLVRQLPSQNTRERMLSMRSADATEMGCQKSPQQGE